MEEKIDIPDLDQVQDLATARFLLKHLSAAADAQAATNRELSATIEGLRQELAELRRALFGQKSERVVPVEREIRKRRRDAETAAERAARLEKARQKREAERDKRRAETPSLVVEHPVLDEQCQRCGLSLAGAAELSDEVTEEYEYVPAHIIRREHRRQRVVCSCGCFAYGETPARVVEGGLYGPGLHAHVAVAKCADSMPLDRQARGFRRDGVALSTSTLCDLFHRTACLLSPLATRALELIATSGHVNADETTMRVQKKKKCRRAYLWDFIATDDDGHMMVAYRFSPTRSGKTPIEVLGSSTGVLQVDGYTGYNEVTTPKKRKRAGCWAHARRKFFDALATSPDEANHAIDLIRLLYEVEYDAAELDIIGSEKHRALRSTKSRAVLAELYEWAESVRGQHLPKSPIGKAFTYLLNQKKSLECFLDEPKVRLDNNVAEQHLRLIALGRKNFLFVGNDQAGRNLAILQTLVSSCIANRVNPQTYMADVLLRLQDHAQSKIDELLPWNWAPLPTET